MLIIQIVLIMKFLGVNKVKLSITWNILYEEWHTIMFEYTKAFLDVNIACMITWYSNKKKNRPSTHLGISPNAQSASGEYKGVWDWGDGALGYVTGGVGISWR